MARTESTKSAALLALRSQLGSRIKSGTEFLQEREQKDLRFATGLGGLDEMFGGGLPRGQLTEIIVPGVSRGGGVVLAELLARARRERHYAMLLDVGLGFSVESFPEADLESLLWVGCDSIQAAVESLDVATRDENFHLFLLDGRDCEAADWRAIRVQQWYRVLQQLRQRDAVAIIFAKSPATAATKHRLEIVSRLSLDCLELDRSEIVAQRRFRPMRGSEARGAREAG